MKKMFLYLDDNDKVTRDGDVEFINALSDRIQIITDYPCSWSQRAKQILKDINDLDGLILDWEFTNQSEDAKQGTSQADDVDFSAESLSEHIRVSVVQKGIKDIPIIICSADKNKAFTRMRVKELTSRDLFDLAFTKNELFVNQVENSEAQLFDLACSYTHLQQEAINLNNILGIEDNSQLDIRFIEALESLLKNNTVHDQVQFLLNEFILREGLLINDDVVAARLGIDKMASAESWLTVLSILEGENIVYHGLLSIGWKNFWSHKLEEWWQDKISLSDLRTMNAQERILLLNSKLSLNLVAASKIKFCTSDEFWTVCYGTGMPIDTIDGFRIEDGSSQAPWIEIRYVSAFAELEKQSSDLWKISILDRERYNHFKSILK